MLYVPPVTRTSVANIPKLVTIVTPSFLVSVKSYVLLLIVDPVTNVLTIVGKVTRVPAPVIYCAVVPPGAKACVCDVLVTAFVDASVVLEGVPSVIVPDVVKLVKSKPLPLFTPVTVPVFVVYPLGLLAK